MCVAVGAINMCKHAYLSAVQVVTLYGTSAVCVFQSPLGSSLTCRVKYLSGEEPEPPICQWRRRRRDSTPSWGTDSFLGGWGRSVDVVERVKDKKRGEQEETKEAEERWEGTERRSEQGNWSRGRKEKKKKATNYLIARAISFWLKKQQHFAW